MSPGFTGIKKYLYVALRLGCLAFTCAALPLAYFYAASQNLTAGMPVILHWLVGMGAVFWGLLYLCLSQFAFAGTLWGAVFTAIGLGANAVTGMSLGAFNLAYGGYTAVWCSLVGQALFMLGATCMAAIPPLKNKYLPGLPSWYTAFLAIMTLSLGLMAYALHRPFFTELASEPRLWLRAAYVAAFGAQVISEMRVLKRGSIFQNGAAAQSETTWKGFEAYTPYVAIGLIVSLCSVIFMWMWRQ